MDRIKIILIYISVGLSFVFVHGQQIGNYVNNGSFEETYTVSIYSIPKYWCAPDSGNPFMELIKNPSNNYGYQLPKSGNNYIISLFYCSQCGVKRSYPKNRLKGTLKAGVKYCVKMWIAADNNSTHAIDDIGIYFGDNSIDTITKCNDPIGYLTPQIVSPPNTFITDTLNWTLISGQFTATGIEKYLVVGNFNSDINTNLLLVDSTYLPANFSQYYIDDLSVIEDNLRAFAGRDTTIYLGDSLFIGRQPDYATDPGCIWYKLPNMTTAIDTISGLWVKPSVISTYVVRQELDCSSVKWDTVVVSINTNLVGLDKLQSISDNISLFPNPTPGNLNISFFGPVPTDISKYIIIDNLGQIIREQEIDFKKSSFIVSTSDLVSGVYQIQFKSQFGTVTKKFVKTN